MKGDPVPADLASAMAHAGFPPLVYFDDIGSTNDAALQLASSFAPEWSAVLADHQRTGRGRRGRPWCSPPGAGLYLSVVVGADDLGGRVPLVTLAAGVAAAQAVTEVSGLPVELKWPNDLVIGRPWRKLAGILCEASGLGAPGGAVVVGLGVNLLRASYPPEVADRATSLDAECDRPITRADLVVAFLMRLREQVTRLRHDQTKLMLDEWRQHGRVGLAEAPVQWSDDRGLCRGITCGLADDGALLVRKDGHVERLIAGDVIWEMLSRV